MTTRSTSASEASTFRSGDSPANRAAMALDRTTSELTPGNNIGFPTEPGEVDHLVGMFTDGRKRMTEEQSAALRAALEKAAREAKQKLSGANH